ncbi:MAG TPA: hypothetical protein VFO28_18100 [Burkholderiaceae bacterium]|nr:hypothetical protein [Burkholderiaceae bacterium]
MIEFEGASLEVLAKLHAHQLASTPEAFDDLERAQRRRSRALADMLLFLDNIDDPGKR